MPKFTSEQVSKLEALGWDFVPTAPDEYDWLKFANDGEIIARGGDEVWAKDVATVTEDTSDIEKWEPTVELRRRARFTGNKEDRFMVLEQKFVRVSGGPPCGGGASEWRPLPMVDSDGKSL